MVKVNFFDKRIVKQFLAITSAISASLSILLIFVEIPAKEKLTLGGFFLAMLALIYVVLWLRSNNLEEVNLDIEGSNVTVKKGDIFDQPGFKAIAFNEYFDTQVDDKIISTQSLNGIFITERLDISAAELDKYIENYPFDTDEIQCKNTSRKTGKTTKFSIGTICVYNDYILTAFSKFDEMNRAWLTMPDYLVFLINFWDRVNRVYAQKSVSVPIFGSGITRIKEHKNISDEDLLKIMLWTFRISEMRFKYPAKLTIVIHAGKMDRINLLDIRSAKNGL
ncbi:hypothetical protein ISF86_29935 [Burkholderia pseudomallei]|uniref:macro domain-containing protein n=1 Tax=Burkholderia pseudomallei TaxID=28450 RepID=UPI000975942D|nr:macro domain-containing protein [Burkholderia pseudomallei]MBF3653966.1 hypothetical protein [Burkholderia pseudomallei]MBF3672180.1 hypothetical protein [Burkholderia pseudomallei]MBF3775405.1 hypothetical protein [Burkholderia pseudomallei]MBF4044414.1 hypothetical protein [Burkholderia pseudomallei]OMS24478.1 hypothetical protein AQ737_26890 [Burkholderia pseudomallei]